MEVNCEGCAGCCLDWRPLLDAIDDAPSGDTDESRSQHDRRRPRSFDADGPRRESLDNDANFVPLTRDEVRTFLDRGLAAALKPRFWRASDETEGVEIDGYTVAAVTDRPAFFIGLRKPPKPVAPFGRDEPTWLPTCVFLDPTTLQCRIHDDEAIFPDECGSYPEYNLALDQETECERVESVFGGDRLLEDSHDDPDGLLLGSQAIGAKLFCHPEPERLEGIVDRAARGDLTAADRTELIAVAAGSSPGTIAISEYHYEQAKTRALATIDPDDEIGGNGNNSNETNENGSGSDEPDGNGNDSNETDSNRNDSIDGTSTNEDADGNWVGPAIHEWIERHKQAGRTVPPSSVATTIEDERGAPETPGWDDVD